VCFINCFDTRQLNRENQPKFTRADPPYMATASAERHYRGGRDRSRATGPPPGGLLI
jgi:hypothetical protein